MNERILYLDCQSGISGDMFVAAAIDLGLPFEIVEESINQLRIDGIRLDCRPVRRCGFAARHFQVTFPQQHHHRHLADIQQIIERAELPAAISKLSLSLFQRLGQAEAKVHGVALEKVHFHEVGAVDSIVDIVSAAVAIDWLSVDRIHCSEIPLGHGLIEIAHGPVSLPAPATAELLTGLPVRSMDVPHELTTPTGAALVAELAEEYGAMPSMRIEKTGYGAGSRDLPGRPNILRLVQGTALPCPASFQEAPLGDQVVVMETNVDHVSAEIIGHCLTQLMECGALDAYAEPIQMKKNRPATKLTVICRPVDAANLENILFEETGTLGIRRWFAARSTLPRSHHIVETQYGPVHGQLVHLPGGSHRFSPEFECCKKIGREFSVPVVDVMRLAVEVFASSSDPSMPGL